MKKEIEKKLSEFLITIFFYFISLVISGIFRLNNVLNILDNEIIESAKLSGYAGLITSSLFSTIVILLISFIAYLFIEIFELKIVTKTLIDGLIVSIYTLIVFEIIRIILTILIFDEAVNSIIDLESIIENLKSSEWYFYDNILKTLMIISTGVVFGINTIKQNKNYLNVIILSVIIFLGFYISTLNVFNNI